MPDIQKVIEYKITGNPADFNKMMERIESDVSKNPI
jgi:hypothetical protein